MYGPSIIVGKMQLRPPHLNEASAFVNFFKDREVTRYLGSIVESPGVKEQKEFFRKQRYDDKVYFWAIAELGTNKAIGSVSLRAVGRSEDKKFRLGIVIADKSKWGRGYGRETIVTLMDFAFYRLQANRLELSCFAPNIRAFNLYRKCGFVEEGRKRQSVCIDGCFHDEIIMSVIAEELPKT